MNLLVRYFQTATQLQAFANGAGNVGAIVSITYDASSGTFVLFYTAP